MLGLCLSFIVVWLWIIGVSITLHLKALQSEKRRLRALSSAAANVGDASAVRKSSTATGAGSNPAASVAGGIGRREQGAPSRRPRSTASDCMPASGPRLESLVQPADSLPQTTGAASAVADSDNLTIDFSFQTLNPLRARAAYLTRRYRPISSPSTSRDGTQLDSESRNRDSGAEFASESGDTSESLNVSGPGKPEPATGNVTERLTVTLDSPEHHDHASDSDASLGCTRCHEDATPSHGPGAADFAPASASTTSGTVGGAHLPGSPSLTRTHVPPSSEPATTQTRSTNASESGSNLRPQPARGGTVMVDNRDAGVAATPSSRPYVTAVSGYFSSHSTRALGPGAQAARKR